MNIKKVLATCLLALMPALALSLPITSMPTISSNTPTDPLRHNVFHAATLPGGLGGAVLAWFDLDASASSTWNPNSGDLVLHVNIFDDAAQSNLLGTATGMGNIFFAVGLNDPLGSITWTFSGAGATGILGTGLTMEFINHTYPGDTAGNIPNTHVGNTVTLWGADGTHNGNGLFDGASLGVDMVFVVPEPTIILLMAMGLLGFGASARRR